MRATRVTVARRPFPDDGSTTGSFTDVPSTPPDKRYRFAIVAAIILIGVTALIVGGAAQVNGPATVQRPSEIVTLEPNESDQQLPQGEVAAQLRIGLTGQLSIDGKAIPQDQVTINPSLGTISFNPGPGQDIEEFTKGGHTAVLEWWPVRYPTAEAARAKQELRSYTWGFNVG